MKIVVLNGSPKGDTSVTMQYVHFLQKTFPQHEMKIMNISQRIQAIEKDEKTFQEIIHEISLANGVLWAFPLYFYLVHAHYKRFIELIFERGVEHVFHDKYTAALSSSIHICDHIAHNYINAICDDLDMKYVGAFSAFMYDLIEEESRKELSLFAEHFFRSIEKKSPTTKSYQVTPFSQLDYLGGGVASKIDIDKKRVLVLTDSLDGQTNLGKMIERFSRSFAGEVEVINLNDVDIKSGCQGCLQCSYDNNCSYGDEDGYIEFFNTKVRPADVLVIAGTIKDHYLSSRWKMFFDRSYFNNHIPVMAGKQIGFIISGPLRQRPVLRQALEAYFQIHQGNIVDFITDEYESSAQIDELLQSLAERLLLFAGEDYFKPATFLGIGVAKIVRDYIFGRGRFPFQADHRYFQRHGLYDFPQKEYMSRIINLMLILFTKIPSIRKDIYTRRIKTQMVKPLQKLLEMQ